MSGEKGGKMECCVEGKMGKKAEKSSERRSSQQNEKFVVRVRMSENGEYVCGRRTRNFTFPMCCLSLFALREGLL